MTLGRANVFANVDPGSGSRYGGGGVRGFDVNDISMGDSQLLLLLLLAEFDSLNGFMPAGDGGE